MTDNNNASLRADAEYFTKKLNSKEFDLATLLLTPHFIRLFEFINRALISVTGLLFLAFSISTFLSTRTFITPFFCGLIGLAALAFALIFTPRESIVFRLIEHCALRKGRSLTLRELGTGFTSFPVYCKALFFVMIGALLIINLGGGISGLSSTGLSHIEVISALIFHSAFFMSLAGALLNILGGLYYHKLIFKELHLSINSYENKPPHHSDAPLLAERTPE